MWLISDIIRNYTKMLKFFTALWIFTLIEMYIWKWHLFLPGSSLGSWFGLFSHELISKFMPFKIHFALFFYVAYFVYIYQRYLLTCKIACSYPIQWWFKHPVL